MQVFHAYQGDVFDPAAECGIASVSMFLDTIQFNPPFVGAAGQGVAAAIRQNGTVYLGGSFITPEQTWTPRSLLGLAANDFTAVGGTTHPDFTAAGAPIEVGFTTSNSTCHGCSGHTTQVGYDNFRFELTTSPDPESYCTAGISASGCQASIGSSGTPSASAPSGFSLIIGGVEGQKDGLFFFGTNGRQGNPWGNGTSYQCVVPPVKRTPLIAGVGTIGTCDGTFSYDLNAHWTPSRRTIPTREASCRPSSGTGTRGTRATSRPASRTRSSSRSASERRKRAWNWPERAVVGWHGPRPPVPCPARGP